MPRTLRSRIFVGTSILVVTVVFATALPVMSVVGDAVQVGAEEDLERGVLALDRYLALRYELLADRTRTLADLPYLKATLEIESLDRATANAAARELAQMAGAPLVALLSQDGSFRGTTINTAETGFDVPPSVWNQRAYVGVRQWGDDQCFVAISPILAGQEVLGLLAIGEPIGPETAEELRVAASSAAVALILGPACVASSGFDGDDSALDYELSPTVTPVEVGDSAAVAVTSRLPESEVDVLVVRRLDTVARVHRQAAWGVLVVGTGIALLALLAGHGFARRISRPLKELTDAACRMAEGDLHATVHATGQGEIGALGKAFNSLSSNLLRHIDQAKDREAAIEAARAKGVFVANISHEIRTPLNGLIGMIEVLGSTELNDDQREYVEIMASSSQSLLALLNDVLDYSKIDNGMLELEKVAFDIRETVIDHVKVFAARAQEKGLELVCRIAPDVPRQLLGDGFRLGQIVANLVGNAIKFTNDGEVVVDVETTVRPDGVLLRINVTDSGVGIPADQCEGIFECFSQADESTTRRFGGTGLGLAIVRQLSRFMGGEVAVRSVLGVGSTFRVTAMVDEVSDAASEPAASVAAGSVLVVEDHDAAARVVVEALVGMGADVTRVRTPEEALDRVRERARQAAPFAVTMVDSTLPGPGEGASCARRLAAEPSAGSVIRMLGIEGETSGPDGSNTCGAYVRKPLSPARIRDAVRQVLEPAAASDSVSENQQPPMSDSLHVLVAEDNTVNQRVATLMLGKMGHSCVIAANGRMAVEALEREEFDLVLMDVQMPEMSGAEATVAIREREAAHGNARVPIVALTASALHEDRTGYIASGMNGCLSKPLMTSQLAAEITRLGIRGSGLESSKGPREI